MKSTVMHIRIPLDVKREIDRLASQQRRPWTQMTNLILRDAVFPGGKKNKPRVKETVDIG